VACRIRRKRTGRFSEEKKEKKERKKKRKKKKHPKKFVTAVKEKEKGLLKKTVF
jgi:hypothetical protein